MTWLIGHCVAAVVAFMECWAASALPAAMSDYDSVATGGGACLYLLRYTSFYLNSGVACDPFLDSITYLCSWLGQLICYGLELPGCASCPCCVFELVGSRLQLQVMLV